MGNSRGRLVAIVVLLGLLGAPLAAQQVGGFHNLRFEEDWSGLADEQAEAKHLFPVIKWIELDDEWALSTGGQVRWRPQNEQGKSLRDTSPGTNDFNLLRTRLHGDLRHESGFRVFVELLDARIYGEERPPIGIDRQELDLHNAFVEYAEGDSLVRAGRFELQYGAQRYVSPLDWGNTRRRFEGVLGRQQVEAGTLDVFVTHPVPVDPHHFDHDDDSLWFSGAYLAMPENSGGTDLYAFALNERSTKAVAGNGRDGPEDRYTLGARRWGKHGQLDWDAELAWQVGNFAGDTIDAQSASLSAGWTEPDCWGRPRVGLDLDWASGDDDPTDSRNETFDQLFPLAHLYLGRLDLVARQNIIAVQPNVLWHLGERTTLKVEQHFFRLEDRNDALYNAGGAVVLADPTGSAGTEVGRELDVILAHTLEDLAPHARIVFGWSQFEPGDFVETLGSRETVNLFYTEFTFTF